MDILTFYQPNPNFPNRYISPEKLFSYLQTILSDYVEIIGESTFGRPIYRLKWGEGPIKVLAWSQMHGNESNATHAMLDMLYTFDKEPSLKDTLWNEISLDFIFMLNPDGSQAWTRRNGLDIDLNRDFLKLSSKEFPILKNLVTEGNYNYALNLHEQRTIFSTDGVHPATLSFLAPSQSIDREITPTRRKCMAVIAEIADKMKDSLPNRIARYTDEFYPLSAGDNFIQLGIPTILYEGGHYENDYYRHETRKFYTQALYEGLVAIAKLNGSEEGWERYADIPENIEDHYDVIYRDVRLNHTSNSSVDIAVQYRETIQPGDDEISLVPFVVEIGDCSRKKGWKEVDCIGKQLIPSDRNPKLDQLFDFELK